MKPYQRLAFTVACIAAAALSLTGCWDRMEVDDIAFITAIGLDDAPGNQVYVTFQIAVPKALAGGGGLGGTPGPSAPTGQAALITTVMGRSILGVEDLVHAYVDRRPSLVHGKIVVVGETLARQGIAPHISELVRFREVRRTMFLVVAKGTARELLERNRPVLEQNPAKALELLALTNHLTGLVPPSQLHRFLVEMQSLGEEPLVILAGAKKEAPSGGSTQGGDRQDPNAGGSGGGGAGAQPPSVDGAQGFPEPQARPARTDQDYRAVEAPRVGGNPVEFLGAAVFRGDRMVGELTGEEVRAVLLLRGSFKQGTMVSRDPFVASRYVSYNIRLARPTQIRVTKEGASLHIEVKAMLEGEVVGTQTRVDYSDAGNLHALERQLASDIRELCLQVIDKAQNQFQADIFAFGNKARHMTATWREWEDFDWPGKFPEASVDVRVKVDLRRTGLLFRPPEPTTPTAPGAGRG